MTTDTYNTISAAKKECIICCEQYLKSNSVFSLCCSKRMCPDCVPKLNKCPHCRTSPFICQTLVTTVPLTVKKRVVLDANQQNMAIVRSTILNEFIQISIDLQVYNDSKCNCRKTCQHKKCICIVHNHKFVRNNLNKMCDSLRKLFGVIDDNIDVFVTLIRLMRIQHNSTVREMCVPFAYNNSECSSEINEYKTLLYNFRLIIDNVPN